MYIYFLGKKSSAFCANVDFPNHTQERFRKPCGAKLMKTVCNIDATKSFLYPYKVYASQSLKTSFQRFLNRQGFKESLFHKHTVSNEMRDIYDGRFFKTFLDSNGVPFFENRRNIGVLLNLDWFNPFKRTEYSLGVLYLVIVNLPRSERFLWKNVIVLGIIPGPKEPSYTINSYLHYHVNELLLFWNGVVLNENGTPALYKIALVGCSNDVPATRKLCGFLAHNANKGEFLQF